MNVPVIDAAERAAMGVITRLAVSGALAPPDIVCLMTGTVEVSVQPLVICLTICIHIAKLCTRTKAMPSSMPAITITDVNECKDRSHRCSRDQECRNTEGGYSCLNLCPPGYQPAGNGSCVGKRHFPLPLYS